MKNVKARGLDKPVYGNVYLLDSHTAERLFLEDEVVLGGKQVKHQKAAQPSVEIKKLREADADRQITIGVNKVAEEPDDADFKKAAVYEIKLPEHTDGRSILHIDYRGDCARLYADGKLVADNFYNGRPFLMGLWRLPKHCKTLELRILPLQKDMPVYFPREADASQPGEEVKRVHVAEE